MRARFVVAGGYVLSQSDGQRHYVSAGEVARLHNLRDDQWQRWNEMHRCPPETVFLEPRYDGNYRDLSQLEIEQE